MPCLMYLPTLTKEADSILLLEHAYPALLTLACNRFPENRQQPFKFKALERVMRYGIIEGFAHAAGYVKINEIFVKNVSIIAKLLGMHVVKTLKVNHNKRRSR